MTEEKLVVFHADVKFETDKAFLVIYNGVETWLPKSQIRKKRNIEDKKWKFGITAWLAGEKGITADGEGVKTQPEPVHNSQQDEPPVDDDIPF